MQQTNNKKGRIGLICATEGEIATLISSIDEATISRKSMLEFYQGTIKGVPVAAAKPSLILAPQGELMRE